MRIRLWIFASGRILLGVHFPKTLHMCTSFMIHNLRDRMNKSNHLPFLLYLGGKLVNCLCKIYISKHTSTSGINLNLGGGGEELIGQKSHYRTCFKTNKKLFANYNHASFFSFGLAISQHCPVCFSMDRGICNTLHTSSASQASPLAVDLPPHTKKQRTPATGSERFVVKSYINNGCCSLQHVLI